MQFQFYWPSWYKWWRISYNCTKETDFFWPVYNKVLCIGPLQWQWYSLEP